MKYLYPYECEKRGLSSPGELQAAIDSNRREGRRQSYGSAILNCSLMGSQSLLSSPKIQMSHLPIPTHNSGQISQVPVIKKGKRQQQRVRWWLDFTVILFPAFCCIVYSTWVVAQGPDVPVFSFALFLICYARMFISLICICLHHSHRPGVVAWHNPHPAHTHKNTK